ncbi:MAG: hypothetical protein QOH63_3092 [Acidobacteriota bacterium]|jgi:hypothetical protein|nr:hypothetical protein [Acidobacteriota bacterium]
MLTRVARGSLYNRAVQRFYWIHNIWTDEQKESAASALIKR